MQFAPNVKTVLEVDLCRYLTGLKKLIVPLVRPEEPRSSTRAERQELSGPNSPGMPADRLTFADRPEDRVAAYFHTGGTTGMPKVAQHKVSGMVYNGWLGDRLLFKPDRRGDVPAAAVPRLCLPIRS